MARETKDNIMQIYRIAKHYYLDNLSQNEISKIEQISRPQVSRYLKRARELGCVHIDITFPKMVNEDYLVQNLKDKYHMEHAVIAPSQQQDDLDTIYWSVTTTAAHFLQELLPQYQTIGLGWGEAVFYTAMQLTYLDHCSSMSFVPLVGNTSFSNRTLQTNNIVDRFGEKFIGSKSYYMNSPLYVPEKDFDNWMTDLHPLWDKLDIAVLGLGGPTFYSKMLYIDELGRQKHIDINFLMQSAFGDILGNFFLKDGTIFSAPDNYRLAGIPLEKLKQMDHVIGLAFGSQKVPCLKYALENGYINSLVTDYMTAQELLK